MAAKDIKSIVEQSRKRVLWSFNDVCGELYYCSEIFFSSLFFPLGECVLTSSLWGSSCDLLWTIKSAVILCHWARGLRYHVLLLALLHFCHLQQKNIPSQACCLRKIMTWIIWLPSNPGIWKAPLRSVETCSSVCLSSSRCVS